MIEFLSHLPTQEHTKLLMLGATRDWAFALGTLLLALKRHCPKLEADILLLHDGSLAPKDAQLFAQLGAQSIPFTHAATELDDEARHLFSPLSLAKFLALEFLETYEKVLWLDADIVIQDSIDDIWAYGPFSLAYEDAEFTESALPTTAAINVTKPVEGLDGAARNINSGVFLVTKELSSPKELLKSSAEFLHRNGKVLRYPDQAIFNMLVQKLSRESQALFSPLPQEFNCHPRNPLALYAPIVHAFGAYKLWNDGLTQACFPEWQRDYRRWVQLGGSPYTGTVENATYSTKGTFALLRDLFATMTKSDLALKALASKLKAKEALCQKLTALLEQATQK